MIRTNDDASSAWSWHQDKLFERALVMFSNDESSDRWEKIAAQVPGKSAADVRRHYEDLEHDVLEIESGRVELPSYEGELESASWVNELFLIGLQKYGKGDWRSISRNAVVSRTPTQVASHAQKYFLRLNSVNEKNKKRSSIHDLKMGDDNSMDPQSKFFNEQGSSFVNNHGYEFPLL
ncbi:hypothetical protein GOBAR_DD31842 [Gossypium barbadense]|nr:hypothetical protein GOBAR_DD31842 [Gossypium barbadense]